jgi:cytochrome P450
VSLSGYSVTQNTVETFLNGTVYQLYAQAKGEAETRLTIPVVADADSIREILGDPARFPKRMGLVGTLGNSRFNTNGAEWEARRDLTQRLYLSAGSPQNASKISTIYHARLASCDATPDAIQRALMLAASEVFFGALNCQVNVDRLHHLFEQARRYVKRLQYFSWNATSASDARTLNEEASHLAREFEAEVHQSSQLRELMATFGSRAKDLHDFNPLDELLMNFFAGIETTAATLSFAIDRLGIDARVQQRLYDEILSDQGDPYLDCFVQETLRYFPTIPFVVRQATLDAVLKGTALTRGQPFLISIIGLHHDPSNWNEPDIFDCSRPEFLDNTYDRRAFLPFLAGPRMCGGARLAKMELNEGLKAFMRRFSVKGGTDEVGFDYGLALRPRTPAGFLISRRGV